MPGFSVGPHTGTVVSTITSHPSLDEAAGAVLCERRRAIKRLNAIEQISSSRWCDPNAFTTSMCLNRNKYVPETTHSYLVEALRKHILVNYVAASRVHSCSKEEYSR